MEWLGYRDVGMKKDYDMHRCRDVEVWICWDVAMYRWRDEEV